MSLLRAPLLRLLRLALRLRARPLSAAPGPLLVIAPHQDDEILGCGALLATRQARREPSFILFLTDGSASHPDHPVHSPAAITALRRQESGDAASRLGLDSSALFFLNLPDGRLPHLSAQEKTRGLARLDETLRTLAPETVLVPLHQDGSSEHQAAHHLVREALRDQPSPPRLLGYPVWALYSPRLLLRVVLHLPRARRLAGSAELAAAKKRALSAYVSQLAPLLPWTTPVLAPEFVKALSHSEEFFFDLTP